MHHTRGLVVLGGSFLALGAVGWVLWLVAAGSTVESVSTTAGQYVLPTNQPAPVQTKVSVSHQPPMRTSHGSTVPVVSDAWVAKMASETGIPAPAVRAYGRAQLEEPASCHLGWTTLAGIGEVETGHGEGAGATLHPDGLSLPTIVSSADAFGPMQFLASTWDKWKTDGDGDGWARINDIDDAAAAAMRYLCSYGDLSTSDGWARAIFAYNHQNAYVQSVYNAAVGYNALAR